ncbi:sigma-70 family RNA polymerase sigma factor [Proteiniclasticum sp.]|uniref:RNA polymerase sigma factor n=1 Tax=Proteiniclasticum sp. TaxID=2053595 RepID=UPI00289914EE|nr:sigma-70 family RNA polymerase sigma factor [Proteiniclasticum sp.]
MKGIDKIYSEYFQTVYKYLFTLTQDADVSEELTQETFYQAVKTFDRFRGESKVSVWLCQIAKHLWYKEYKRRNRFTEGFVEEMSDLIPSSENLQESVIESDIKIALYQKIRHLDEKTREVIYLRLTGELSFREIGEIMMRNETWARVIFYRGKQKLMSEEERE